MIDYLFLSSSSPAPAMLAKVRIAQEAGRKPMLVYFCRPGDELVPDLPPDCVCVAYPVAFTGVSPRRLLVLAGFERWLRKRLYEQVRPKADCYCETFDMMFIAMIAGRGRGLRHRFEARDLHALQFGRGLLSILTRLAERWAIPKLHTLVLTSEKFWEEYYHKYAPRRYVVVENVPRRDHWAGFARQEPDRVFRIGFVGVIRYYECLVTLVDAVRQLRGEGLPIAVRFAGGGDDLVPLRAYCRGEPEFEFTGPFAYSHAVQRIYADLDLIYSVYDSRQTNVRYAMPNKFYEAHIAQIPIMVAAGTYLESRVRKSGIGIGVPCLEADKVAAALREAVAGCGWYAAAKEVCERNLAESYFQQHNRAIHAAVLE